MDPNQLPESQSSPQGQSQGYPPPEQKKFFHSEKRGHIGITFGIIAFIFVLVSLAAPWWQFNSTSTDPVSLNTCYSIYYTFFQFVSFSSNCSSGVCAYNWRTGSGNLFFNQAPPSHTESTFDVAGSFTGFALICSILILIHWIMYCCGKSQRNFEFGSGFLAIAAIVFLLIAIITFAVNLPNAFSSDGFDLCGLAPSPCTQFSGSATIPNPTGPPSTTYNWGGIGVWIAVVASFFFIPLALNAFIP